MDPVRDIETIDLELIFADLEVLERRMTRVGRSARNDKDAAAELSMMQRLKEHLENGKKGASLESIVNICLVLDLSLDELITGAPKTYEDEYVDAVISVFQRCTDREKHFLSELVIYADAVLKKHKVFQPESIFTKKFWKP